MEGATQIIGFVLGSLFLLSPVLLWWFLSAVDDWDNRTRCPNCREIGVAEVVSTKVNPKNDNIKIIQKHCRHCEHEWTEELIKDSGYVKRW